MSIAGAVVNAQTITQSFGTGANAFSIDFVEIGNPGNAPDTTGNPNPAGSVSYIYNLGKYEISRDMIEKASSEGGLGITLQDMTGLGENGVNRPATGITWNEAARFVNWLNTSQMHQAAYNFDGNGNLLLWGSGEYSGNNQFRHKDAYYFLPSSDEWYKGAYGSLNGTWYNFATASDSAPIAVSGGTISGTTVYGWQASPADITDAGGSSAFGTIAQGGNVWEWLETAADGVNDSANESRELRGGSFARINSNTLDASSPSSRITSLGPNDGDIGGDGGFRIAMVPEPSALSLLAVGLGGLAIMRRRRS